MPSRHITVLPTPAAPADAATTDALLRRLAQIRTDLKVPQDFSSAALADAQAAADSHPSAPADLTDVAFWTLDPVGSMDLDQAMALERDGDGYRVRYAIADVPHFVTPGSALDTEVRARGLTIYAPDGRVPLHPPVLSEAAASLLPDQVRPAYVWDLRLAADGTVTSAGVARAMVRSQVRRDYVSVQADVDAGTPDEQVVLLREIGGKRAALESARGGASLPMPEQEVHPDGFGGYVIELRPPVPAEDWNAQISLMTGMAAADIMVRGGIGILRTMPDPEPGAVKRFRRQATALGVPWPQGQRYGDFLRSLDRHNTRHLALIHEATSLFRGAGYTPFEGEAPSVRTHAAVAAPYAHVTAPLRRLVDRFGLVVCESLCSGSPVPGWVREALPALPDLMAQGDRRASAVERASTDAVEAAVLAGSVGRDFSGSVVDVTSKGMPVVQLLDPAVVGLAAGSAKPGTDVTVRVTAVDVEAGSVRMEIVGQR